MATSQDKDASLLEDKNFVLFHRLGGCPILSAVSSLTTTVFTRPIVNIVPKVFHRSHRDEIFAVEDTLIC